eukprot:TRINITY_DN1307_c0_g1_i2.p1 TRINITY_DN1307_c0_g1~~TRINITY_DN1307_c0_g1_i2.p1  ORF type:complete len:306 (+),score=39.94 TRINITY_DN1307_c0_g1_i2:506-1423(+)
MMNGDTSHLSFKEQGIIEASVFLNVIWLISFSYLIYNWRRYKSESGTVHKLLIVIVFLKIIHLVDIYFYWSSLRETGMSNIFIIPFYTRTLFRMIFYSFLFILSKGYNIIRNSISRYEIECSVGLLGTYLISEIICFVYPYFNFQIASVVILIGIWKYIFTSLRYASSKLGLQQQYLSMRDTSTHNTDLVQTKLKFFKYIQLILLVKLVIDATSYVLELYLTNESLTIFIIYEVNELLTIISLLFPLRLGFLKYQWIPLEAMESSKKKRIFILQYPKKHQNSTPNITFASKPTAIFTPLELDSSD